MPAMLLCVQRDRELGQLYADALTAEGYEVLCANDGRGAFDVLSRQNPGLVILDAQLPRQDGFEILVELRTRPMFESLPVLLLSEGDVTEEIRERATELGAVGVERSPLDPEQLIAKVSAHVSPMDKPRVPPLPASNEGRFRELPFAELLRRMHGEGFDGALLLEFGKKKKAVEFRDGWPVSVKSNLVSECFGSYLVAQGRCSREEMDESIQRMRTGEGLQGEILVAMEVLDEAAVAEALQAHALEKFFEIFSWRDGRFDLRRGARVQRSSSFGIEGHPSRLIVEGIRRYYPLKQIDQYLSIHRNGTFFAVGYEEEELRSIGLAEDEVRWLRKIDGPKPIAALLSASEPTRRIAFGLISIDLLEVRSEAHEATAESSAVEPMAASSPAHPVDTRSEEEMRSELASLANSMQNKDYYGVLGVSAIADDGEIQAAYRELAGRTHPDRFHAASSSVRQLAAQVYESVTKAYKGIATAEDRTNYARELSQGQRDAAAEDEGRRALRAETEFQRGEKLLAARDYENALVHFGRAMENFPREGEYRCHYGWCLYLCHPDNEIMLNEALEHCRAGVKLAKDREKPYLLLGRLYKAMGRVGAAKKMFMRAVEIRPQCVEAMRELRIMNMRREKDKGVLKRIFRR